MGGLLSGFINVSGAVACRSPSTWDPFAAMTTETFVIAIPWLIVFIAWLAFQRLHERLRAIEAKLNKLLASQGISAFQEPSAEVLALVHSGKKIEAMKMYRKQTGVGLKDAKEVIDATPSRQQA